MSEDQIPVNASILAERIKRGRSYVCAMKAAGYDFTHGNRTLVGDALKWLRKNPDFRSTAYHSSEKKADRKRQPRPLPATVGTADE